MTVDLNKEKKRVLVYDIETCSIDPDGNPVDIKGNFDMYVQQAKVRWFGAYSYKHENYFLIPLFLDNVKYKEHNEQAMEAVLKLMEEHDVLVGFNSLDFDSPITKNNGLWPQDDSSFMMDIDGAPYRDKYFIEIDLMVVLGSSVYLTRGGQKFKNRGQLMGYKFKKNSLRHMAEVMGLETQKGDIDYNLFFVDEWTADQMDDMKKYLKADVEVTKQMFDKLWEYWEPFTEFISEDNIKNFSWLRASIASLTYKAACYSKEVDEIYGNKTSDDIREMGGRVKLPIVEVAHDCTIVDIRSLYPHMMVMFGLFKEVEEGKGWNGNEVFKTKGYYDVSEQSILGDTVKQRLQERISMKKNDPDNPKIYALKIFLNALYGITSSEVFEQVYSENIGWDVCYIGQQVIILAENMMDEFGYETIGSDTDSLFIRPKNDDVPNTREHIQQCLDKIVEKIKDNAPFPTDTFGFDIENRCPQMVFPYSLQPVQDENGNNIKEGNRLVKKQQPKKKNYMYLFKKKDGTLGLKVKGLPIIKDNSTHLGNKILNDILIPIILKRKNILFTKEEMNYIVEEVFKKPGSIDLLAVEWKVKKAESYKNPNQIQAQISQAYFNGDAGVIELIKNKKIGKVGKGKKYATIEEVREANLEIKDLDLEKLHNELEPFVVVEDEQ